MTWTIMSEDGGSAIAFTSFIGMRVNSDGSASSYPVEEGAFASYNKMQAPIEITVNLGKSGEAYDIESTIQVIEKYKQEATKLSVVTPTMFYESMTLESYSYSHRRDNGARILLVELRLKEVKEVTTQTTDVDAGGSSSGKSNNRNPTSNGTTNTGRQQAQNVGNGKGSSLLGKLSN
jgi:hypothetical protein